MSGSEYDDISSAGGEKKSLLRFMFFNENIVCLYYGDFDIFNFVNFHHTIEHQHSMFWTHDFTEKCLLRPKKVVLPFKISF